MVSVVTKSVGTAVGRDFSTVTLALASVPANLVTSDEQWNLELYDDSNFSEDVDVDTKTTDATRYIAIYPGAGQRYEPATNTGVVFTNATAGNKWRVNVPFTRVTGLGIDSTYAGGSTTRCLLIAPSATDCILDSVYGKQATATFVGVIECFLFNNAVKARNCIAVGGGDGVHGAIYGFDCSLQSSGSVLENCNAYAINGGPGASDGIGFLGTAPGTLTVINCIAIDCIKDFDVIAGAQSYNCSSDGTADGTGSLTSKTAAEVWVDAPGNDFHLATESPCINTGNDLSAQFTTDFAGTTRTGSWEIGAYDFSDADAAVSYGLPLVGVGR